MILNFFYWTFCETLSNLTENDRYLTPTQAVSLLPAMRGMG
jgi:hypothetical protein